MSWKAAPNLLVVFAIAATCLLGNLSQHHSPFADGTGASALTGTDSHSAHSPWERTEETSVREVVFRYQLRQEAFGHAAPTCFLSDLGSIQTERLTADAGVLKRLARDGYHVAPGPEGKAAPGGIVRDRATGVPGVSLEQSDVRWLGPREVEVDGSRYESPQRQSCAAYCVVCRAGVWRVSAVAPFAG